MPPADWPGYNQCNTTCPNGPTGCNISSTCTTDHWLPYKHESCHGAMQNQGSEGMGTVINLVNGGYDCCPSSSYRSQYGHVTFRIWWFLDIVQTWTGSIPFSQLSPVPVNDCPLG